MTRVDPKKAKARSFKRGFVRAAGLVQGDIRKAGESRGFAVTRLVTHWAEVVGVETAQISRPVKVSYGRDGFGATLTVLTTGAYAPMLQADLPKIKDRVNACYGYSAISKVRITQTAATGFAEGQAQFVAKKSGNDLQKEDLVSTKVSEKAKQEASQIHDEGLRCALERLGQNILIRK